MADLINHPGMWLADDAAASLARWEARYGVLELSDAGRTDAEQAELVRRWREGGKYNRPPYLYEPAVVSPHQKGTALDTPDHDRFGATCSPYGWRFNIASDPVHAIYEPANDQYRGQSSPASGGIESVIKRMEMGMTVAISAPSGTAILIFPGGEYPVSGSEGKEIDGVKAEDRNVGGVIDAVWGKRVPLNQTDVNTVLSLNRTMAKILRGAVK